MFNKYRARKELSQFHKTFFIYAVFWSIFKFYSIYVIRFESYFTFVSFFVGSLVLWAVYFLMAIWEGFRGGNYEKTQSNI
jgi:hypothetical protein